MRIKTVLLGVCLLSPTVCACAAASERPRGEQASPAAAASIPHPAISAVTLRNLGPDAVRVVLSRRSSAIDFYHFEALLPGTRVRVAVPNLPRLRASILRRSDLERIDRPPPGRSDRGGSRRATSNLALGLALAAGSRGTSDRERADSQSRRGEDRSQDRPPEGRPPGEIGYPAEPRDPDEGRPPEERYPDEVPRPPIVTDSDRDDDGSHASTHRAESSAGQRNNLDNALALGALIASGRRRNQDPAPQEAPPDDAFAGAVVMLEADDGSGSTTVHDLELDPSVVNISDAADPERATLLDILQGSNPADAAAPCYCGPDMTEAYIAALKRARARIDALPDSETGAWDGIGFLMNNGGSIDERVRPARRPGVGTEDDPSNWLCPTGACADLPGPGGTTMSLFGHCLPQHVGNDIMYGFVAALLGVPWPVQTAGGYYADYSSYGSLDPAQSRSAYKIGNYIAELDADEMTEDNVREKVHQSWRFRELGGSLNAIEQAYPALAQCETCPADYVEPGQLLRDWSMSEWTLNDGTKALPPSATGQNP